MPIPGLDVVGRGVYVRPQQPYELKGILFPRSNDQHYYSKETGQTYAVPEGYEVNDSPPMPADQALNQVLIEESWDRFEKQTSLVPRFNRAQLTSVRLSLLLQVVTHQRRARMVKYVNYRQLKQAACCWRCQRPPQGSTDNPQR